MSETVILNENLRRIKITIHGPDRKGKNTTRQISVFDSSVDDVVEAILKAARKVNESEKASA